MRKHKILNRSRNYFRFKTYHNINHELSATSASIFFVCMSLNS